MLKTDVAVVGAGPAGLSAALRARWVKAYRGVPCSVRVYDPAPIGGLGCLGRTRLAGPSSRTIIDEVIEDAESFNIPFETAAVDRVRRTDEGWLLSGDGRDLCSATAVVVATGLRRLSNEASYFGRGLAFTYNGYDYISEHLDRLLAGSVTSAVIIGNAKTRNLLPVLQLLERPEVALKFLLNEPPSEELARIFGMGDTFFGRVARFGGEDTVEFVIFRDHEGKENHLPCERVFVDFSAFQVNPEITIDVEGLERDENGFLKISRDGATNLDGVFAAGDGTGVFFMAIKAFAEGSAAGFSAYRHVFERKFGYAPSLTNYVSEDHEVDPDYSDYPELLPTDIIEILGGLDDANRVGAETVNAVPFGPGETRVLYGDLTKKLGKQGAQDLVFALLDAKLCTIEPRERQPRSPAPRIAVM
jgi:thioredoxin reductase